MTWHTSRGLLGAGSLVLASALVLAGCSSSNSDSSSSSSSGTSAAPSQTTVGDLTSSSDPLTLLIAPSGDAELNAVEKAVAAWSGESGIKANVQTASDLAQQLSQGFAAGSPPDLFYMGPDAIGGFAANGSLKAYGDLLKNKSDFYPALVDNFTVDGNFYCAPKDFSTLALVINTDMWTAAGLTDADIPQTWDDLAKVSAKLTGDGHVGLGFGAEFQRIGVFTAEAGGGLVVHGKADVNSAANLTALQYVQSHLKDGTFAYASDLGAGWGGEAFGKQLAAMVIEGNWITGAMSADFPNVKYRVVELPAGPVGKGTLQYTNCWGMAADSPNQKAALDLVEYLTSPEQQLAFSAAFGPMPSIASAADAWTAANPNLAAFLAGASYAQYLPSQVGASDVVKDLNSQLESLKVGDPAAILDTEQANLQAVVG
jgi:multiple sugar transport system substrate-binding protein